MEGNKVQSHRLMDIDCTMGTKALDRTVRMEAPPLERKLAAIVEADVVGYSRLMNADEEQTLATLTSHRTIIDGLIEIPHGQIFGTAGDSVLAELPSIVHASHCAVAIQQAMWRANRSLADDRKMNFRIGINVGDVLAKEGAAIKPYSSRSPIKRSNPF